jgi:SRSO17 transposase
VSLSVATWSSSLPIAYRLYLPNRLLKNGAGRYSPSFPSFLPEAL